IAQAKKLADLDPENAAARQRLGIYYFRKGKGSQDAAKQAYAEFEAAQKLDKNLNAEITLAQLFQGVNEPEKGKTWVEYAVNKAKSNPDPKNNLAVLVAAAQLSAAANRLDDAKKYADDAIRADAESADAKFVRAQIARLAGDLPKAESI